MSNYVVTYADGCVTLNGRKVISCGKDGLEIWRGGSASFPACAKIKALGMRLFVAIRSDGRPFIRQSPISAATLMGVRVASLISGTESR